MSSHHRQQSIRLQSPTFLSFFLRLCLCFVFFTAQFVAFTRGIIGNAVFDVVRDVADRNAERHQVLFKKFDQCYLSEQGLEPQQLYVVQDGSGGGGIGNLMLKIKYVG